MTRRLADVARKVGVSEATVSRALNGKSGVSEATRQAVLTALDVLGYERPAALRGVGVRLVGLVMPELQNPIFPALAESVGGALVQVGFTPVLCTRSAGGLTEAEYVSMLLDQQVSGVVFCGGLTQEEHQQLLERGVPVVLLNAAVDHAGFPQVSTSDASAVQQAFAHLVTLGHREIALLVGPHGHVPTERKAAAFTAFAKQAGIRHHIAHALFSFEGGQAAAAELLESHAGVTAVICGSDVLALGTIRAARRLGRSVPRDLSVVGYDDSVFMQYTDPPMTTLRQPIEALARAAVTLLVNQINGDAPLPRVLMHEPELVVRGSTGPAQAQTQAQAEPQRAVNSAPPRAYARP
ncbi:MAG TPA: LacI family DNA-binding transcriptional regulator [Actinocrinis sp.]|jgi:DNA-binding LacI/PurR family transcriptional regulator|uniref:LacI family DNA-binding transcriptional regulator n=1 Tax=Actinocrinis sp. TaxID=1920516 RepID=UPI002DDCE6CA|nr:LacI family DNA-binding transcriptional regulator [Actinocrinis sp.]HEV3171024.1 LacI family DNA-binding transcriptional regulator [Actinocrinis sp.]